MGKITQWDCHHVLSRMRSKLFSADIEMDSEIVSQALDKAHSEGLSTDIPDGLLGKIGKQDRPDTQDGAVNQQAAPQSAASNNANETVIPAKPPPETVSTTQPADQLLKMIADNANNQQGGVANPQNVTNAALLAILATNLQASPSKGALVVNKDGTAVKAEPTHVKTEKIDGKVPGTPNGEKEKTKKEKGKKKTADEVLYSTVCFSARKLNGELAQCKKIITASAEPDNPWDWAAANVINGATIDTSHFWGGMGAWGSRPITL